MTKLGLLLLVVTLCAAAPVTVAAQRGGGGGQFGVGVSRGGGGGQAGGAGSRSGGGGQNGGGGSRSGGGGGSRNGGARGSNPGTPNQLPSRAPDINRPSFFPDGLNRPSMPPAGVLGTTRPTRSPFDATPRTYNPRHARGGIPLGIAGYGGGFYGDGFDADDYPGNYPTVAADRPLIDESSGLLLLDGTPRGAQVFIDSAYVGTVDDLLANGVALSRGRHWLELESEGYDKKLVEINIAPGRALRYRVDLPPARRAALAVIPPRPPETMYAIPGCYGGNKPPVAAALPAGCSMANLRVLKPQRTN